MAVLTAALKGCATTTVVMLALATPAQTATLFDPALRFRTITTEHFVIYFHQGEDRLGARLAAIAEQTWRALRQPLGVEPPRRTHVVLADQTELANGYATPVPYDTIVIYAAWPQGSEFIGDADDWLRVAFTHEFTHIVHLDRSESWARVVRAMFGRVTIAFPNLFLPAWQIEGIATYEESAITGEGRLHAGDFRALVSEAARTRRLEPLDRVNGGLTDWPGGNTVYAYGVGFHQYLADRFGAESLAALADATARRVPYTGSRAFKGVYGESLGDLWRDYETSLQSAQADRRVGPARITRQGFVVSGPRFDRHAPGDVIYSSRNPDEFPSLYRVNVDAGRPERMATRYLGSTEAIGRDAIYFDQQEVRRNVGIYSDLYALSRATGDVRAVTRNARLIDPDLSPDERTIVAVQDRAGGRDLVLVRLKPDATTATAATTGANETDVVSGFSRTTPFAIDVLVSEPETQFNAPRWSPDGRRIAVERHRLGALSEIAVVDVATHDVRSIAAFDRTRVATPTWRPDGAAVVAAAAVGDRPFNLFEFSVDTPAAPRQLTDLTGGATWPDVSPDGKTIVFVGYTADGFDLFTTPYPAGDAITELRGRPETRRDTADPQVGAPSTQPYSPLATLKPTSWSPVVEADSSQVRAGAAVAGVDVLGYHYYAAAATWLISGPADALTPATATPDWQLSYFYDRWRPTFFAAASSQTSFFAGPPSDAGTPTDATLRERELEAGVLLPIRHTRVSHTALVSAFRAVDDYTLASGPLSRNRTALRGAWATTTAHAYGYSVSTEGGVSGGATVELVRRALGSFADATTMTGDFRAYLPGLAPHHVVALRAGGGLSTGDLTVARAFLLGGSAGDSGVGSFSSSAFSLLRGFPQNTFAGTHVALFNADYRFPIARPQRGYGTWPLFIHTIHGAIVGDAGHAWTRTFRADALKTSLGAELSANVVAGYVFPFTLTIGAARGHDGSGVVRDRTTAYVRIGRSF